MIDDLLLRGVVTALFVATAVMFAIASWVHRRTVAYVVSGALHIVMAVAMIAMAWPQGAALPTTGPMVFFLLAAGYFVVVVSAGLLPPPSSSLPRHPPALSHSLLRPGPPAL